MLFESLTSFLLIIIVNIHFILASDDLELGDPTIKYETRILYFKAIHNVIERHVSPLVTLLEAPIHLDAARRLCSIWTLVHTTS